MRRRGPSLSLSVLVMLIACVTSCGLFVSFDDYDTTSFRYEVRGTIDGLGADPARTVKVVLNGRSDPPAFRNGEFRLIDALADGDPYVLATQDAPADISCSVEPDHGTITGAHAMVAVHCLSNDANLESLSVSAGPLSKPFDPTDPRRDAQGATPYTVEASAVFPSSTTTVVAKARQEGAQIEVNRVLTASGVPSVPIVVQPVPNPTLIDIVVTASDRTTKRRYTVTISAAPSDYLKASNTVARGLFGGSVALSGDTVAVGSNGDSLYAGAVYIFTRVGGTWAQQAYIKPSNPAGFAHFGWSVALSGDTLAVGAYADSSNAPYSGAVYVFTRIGTTWVEQAYLKASNAQADANFGSSVALSGETLAVGSPGEKSSATGVNGSQAASVSLAGAVYVFTRSGATWSQQAYVKASNTRPTAYFGTSVALSGDTLAVGSHSESSDATGVNGNQTSTATPGAGATYVFTRSGAAWSQQAYVKASNTRPNAYFGTSVALSQDTLAVGASGETSSATGVNGEQGAAGLMNAGAAYVFARSGSTWSQQAYVKASNTHAGAVFGTSMALSDGGLAVGAYGETSGGIGVNGDQTPGPSPASGAVYRFTRSGASWSHHAHIKASNPRGGAAFGRSVALSANLLVVGSDRESSSAMGVNGNQASAATDSAGAVYVFR